jgi:tetratricopeptide (TPR) repeat protein
VSAATWVSVAVLLAGAAGVATLQPGLARTAHDVKEHDEVYALPPPAQLHVATLGWNAAAVDLLWAKLLVDYGTHWQEHREFTGVPQYADAILELEPDYAPLYKYIDTLLAYRPLQGTEDDARKARAYLERGTRERPGDPAVWMEYGQFVAFIGPSFLHAAADKEAWRKDGAIAMAHAVELGADADYSLTAASMLSNAGEKQAAIRYLRQAYAFTEHPSMAAIHKAIGERLAALQASAELDVEDAAARAIDARWQRELPYLPRDRYVVLGPAVDAARCAGIDGYGGPGCDRTDCCRHWPDVLAGITAPESSAGSP